MVSEISFLPKKTQLDPSFYISTSNIICLNFWRTSGLFGGIKSGKIERAVNALNDVGFASLENYPSGALYRGQFQWVHFVRRMVQEASVLFGRQNGLIQRSWHLVHVDG